MQTLLLFCVVFIAKVQAICSGSLFWDPFSNACVSRTPFIYAECPWQSPVLYYADSSTNQCV